VLNVTVEYTKLPDGVQYPTPAVADELVEAGAVALVTDTPPAVYPVPVTSPVAEYAVVDAFNVAEAKYKAPLNVSAVEAARIGDAPKLWVAVINSPKNEVHMDWVLLT